jgi:PKD domain
MPAKPAWLVKPSVLVAIFIFSPMIASAALAPQVQNAASLLYISPASLGSVAPGGLVTYQVKVHNMKLFTSWDVSVRTDQRGLNATDFSIASNVLALNYSLTFIELSHCINGSGIGCTITDGPGIVHSAVIFSASPRGIPSIDGLLFTITYTTGSNALSSVVIVGAALEDLGSPLDFSISNGIYGNGKLPVVDFSWNPDKPVQGDRIIFNASGSYDLNLGLGIANYTWDFGDLSGIIVLGTPVTSHVFTEGLNLRLLAFGSFRVLLTVTDARGIFNSKIHSITITPRPSFSIKLSRASTFEVLPGGSANFTVSVTSIFDFSGLVNLTATVGSTLSAPTAALSVSQIRLEPDVTRYLTLYVYTTPTTLPSLYSITVSGIGLGTFDSFTFIFAVASHA